MVSGGLKFTRVVDFHKGPSVLFSTVNVGESSVNKVHIRLNLSRKRNLKEIFGFIFFIKI